MDPALEAASQEFVARLRAFARRRLPTHQDAEDVVQDVLAKLVEHSRAVDPRTVRSWLFTVTRRAIIDRMRARRPAASLPDHDGPAADIADEPSALSELSHCLEPMLGELSAEDRALLQRVDMFGESQADVARELGMSPSGLKSRVQRARERLRRAYESCCAIERDSLGTPVEFAARPGAPCGCDAATS